MENNLEAKKVEEELKMGKEIARQLQLYLKMPSYSTDTLQVFVQKILSSFENALSLLNFNTFIRDPVICLPRVMTGMSELPISLTEDANREVHPDDIFGKRKNIARWKEQVSVSPGMGLEDSLDDGFCWRKNGQKQILGSKYPRGFYRCIQGEDESCLARKQVQRSDEDPTIFDITYYGNHTCTPEKQEPKHRQEFHLNSFQPGLKVNTQDLYSDQSLIQSSFQFPCTSVDQRQQMFSTNDSDFQNYDQSIISAAVATDSPGVTGFDFELFDPDFAFDNSGFLP